MQNLLISVLTVFTMAIHANSRKTSLPVVLYGMLGIFIVIGVIVLVTYLLNKLTSKKKGDSDKYE